MKLERLNLSSNNLQGEVPAPLGKSTSLHMINLSKDHLQGQIPSTISGFPLSSFSRNTNLRPPLASCVQNLEGLGWNSSARCFNICSKMLLYVMLRMWCNWRRVSVTNLDGVGAAEAGGTDCKREEEK
ncbi:hypothetical protein ACFXTH_038962 [Malus domestica]